jgi:gamma-glutamylcyclotransferase (GGCT)/AIG2-like uncharacterized protein YtfP
MPNYFAPYGTFRDQAGEPDTPAFRHFRHVGTCLIPGRLYQMGAYPALKPVFGNVAGAGTVKGELIELPWLFDFSALDAYENYYPNKPWACRYVRRRIRLIEPAVVAWVYIYSWPVDRNTWIRSGDWLEAISAGVKIRRFRGDQLPKAKYVPPAAITRRPNCQRHRERAANQRQGWWADTRDTTIRRHGPEK